MKLFAKWLKHRLQLVISGLSTKSTPLDFYGEAVKSMAGRWHGEMPPLTTYHALFDVLRQREFVGNFLELGGGYSTVLARTLFDDEKVNITSVDFYPAKYLQILNSKKNSQNFLKNIDSINKVTVSFDEVEKALVEVIDRLLSFDLLSLRESILKFVSAGSSADEIGALIDKKDRQGIYREITEHMGFINEIPFYENSDAMSGEGACRHIANSGIAIDAVFLDCGEASSLAEFVALEGSLKSGSYVLLHDIYFPKSIKNFLLAALFTLSPEWEVIYQDKVSEQGGVVAVKL